VRHVHCGSLQVDWDIWETTCFYALPQKNYLAVGFDVFGDREPGPVVCLFDVTTWSVLGWFLENARQPTSVAISPNGNHIATTVLDSPSAYVWDTRTGALFGGAEVPGMTAVAFSPDNRYLIAGADQPKAISIWEL
jgi:WD40 repeat protein